MGYLKEAEIPFQFALANAFTLCDAYHCAIHTGTDSNRSFLLTGTNGAAAGALRTACQLGCRLPQGQDQTWVSLTFFERGRGLVAGGI